MDLDDTKDTGAQDTQIDSIMRTSTITPKSLIGNQATPQTDAGENG